MHGSTGVTRRRLVGVVAVALISALAVAPVSAEPPPAGADLYVPPPDRGARRQISELTAARDKEAADLIQALIDTPQAVWFTAGTPRSVQQQVRVTVTRATAKRSVPVLVAYNVPFRDCAQFSAGGATTRAEYEAWIDGFAAGIGDRTAIVILEPDGLGIIPWYDPYGDADGSAALEWCQPAEADPATAANERFAMLRHAVDVLGALPNVTTYLDGTHSAWLGVGDIAHRLAQAGVAAADGFYLNVSNYQRTANSAHYGRWISSCLAFATDEEDDEFFACPNQYWNGGPLPAKIAVLLGEWTGVALSPFGEWSDDADDPALNTSGIDLRYRTMLGAVEPSSRYRDRHEPQRSGTLAAARLPGSAGLVQPTRSRRGPAADAGHRRAARRRLPVGQDPRRVRRRVHTRSGTGGRDGRPGLGDRRSSCR